MIKGFLVIVFFLSSFLLLSAQTNSDSCYKAMPFCGEKIAIPRVLGGGIPCEPCASYGCLPAVTNQFTWVYFKALTSGPVSLHFTKDWNISTFVLYIIWGGFNNQDNVCTCGLTSDKILYCTAYAVVPHDKMINVIA